VKYNGKGEQPAANEPNKCCGRWDMVKTWKLTGSQLREIANEFACAADDEGA
jgi:hypothetical protein